MGRRIEVELTSARDDGSWTWRAAGAKQPKGDVLASLLYEGAKVGDVVKVEAEFHLDGIEVVEVFAPKKKKERTDLLELKTRPLRDDELVTTQRVSRNDRGDRRGGRGRARGRDDRRDRRGGGGSGERRGPRPEAERRPKPKRLRPRRVHRDALLAEVPEEHRPIVEQVIKDGMPGVRAAIEKQNNEAKEAGKPEIDATPILAIAERNLTKARLAEWRDRADAALADAAELDIRDLRSVVVAGSDVARDDETRAQVDQIKKVLDERLESDHAAWLQDLDAAVSEGRVVRGLRLSSRPIKAGAPLPSEIASKLAQQASEALAADVMQDRWATVLDALAFSPVRGAVTPVGIPAEPKEELLAEVRRLSDRIPAIAGLFGIDPAEVPKSAKRRRPPRRGQKGGGRQGDGRGDGKGNRQDGDRGRRDKAKAERPHPGSQPAEKQPAAEAEAKTEADAPQDQAAAEQSASTESTTAAATEAPATDSTAADAATAQAPATDAPAEEAAADTPAPAADETPSAEEPAPAPAAEAQATDAPAAEAQPDEAPADDAPAAEAQPDKAPADEAPADEAPATDEAPVAAPADEAPATDAPADEAPAEASAAEAPATDEAPADAPADEASATQEPAAEAPAAEAPTDAPTDEAPAAKAPAAEAPDPEPAEAPATDAPAAEAPADDAAAEVPADAVAGSEGDSSEADGEGQKLEEAASNTE